LIKTPEYSIVRSINPDGSVASETRGGRTTTFTYDDQGRLTATQPPGGTHQTIIDYDNGGGAWVTITRGTSVQTVNFDGFGRTIETISAIGVHAKTVYDAAGRVIHEGYPYRSTDTSGNTDIGTQIEYDALGRVLLRTAPDGGWSSRLYGADGTVIITELVTALDSRNTTQTWQAFGDPDQPQLASVVDADSQGWNYTYNSLGKLRTVSLGATPLREWTYNSHGFLETESHPESGTTTYTYDVDGNLHEKVDANGKHTTYAYDGNERVRSITADGRLTAITYEPGTDNRTSAVNGADGVIWRYDVGTGRLASRQDAIGSKVFTTAYNYDANDNLSSIHYPSGRQIDVTVNAAGQPTRIREEAANRNYADSVLYHASGGVTSYTAGNGVATLIAYDQPRYTVTGIAAGSLEIGYGDYDYVGNPHTVTTASTGVTFNQALTYDVLDRLTSATGPQGTSTYAYDAHGNRSGSGYTLNSTTLRLSSDGGVSFTYDDTGNALTVGAATLAYTPQNQVETAAYLGSSATYAYDADDQRVKKDAAGSTTYYIRGPHGELLTEWKDPGTAGGHIRDYIYLGSRLLSGVGRDSSEDPSGYTPGLPSTTGHRFATDWQVWELNSGGPTKGTVSAAARAVFHPDMSSMALRLGLQGSLQTVYRAEPGPMFGTTNLEHPKQADVFFEFSIARAPASTDAEWFSIVASASSTDALRLYLTSGRTLVLKHDGGRATPQVLWTSSAIDLTTHHTLELRFECNSEGTHPGPNPTWENLTSWAKVYLDGELVAAYGAAEGGVWSSGENSLAGLDQSTGTGSFSAAEFISPASTTGLLVDVYRVGISVAKNHGDQLGFYGDSWRTTLLEAAGPGSYSQWTGGQPDWRERASLIPTSLGGGNPVTSNNAGQRISYAMESMLARGITGSIGTVMVGVRMNTQLSTNTKAFIRRNGVDTTLTDMVLTNSQFRWYRVANTGWSPTDTIEIGVICGDNATNGLFSVALLVEHNTPAPEPITDTSVRVIEVDYTGNGTAQTVDLGIDLVPTALIVMPKTGATNVEPVWWWESRSGAGSLTQSNTNFGRLWPQRGKFQVVHPSSLDSYNASGVDYTAIALFDPSGRFSIPFAESKPSADDNYTHYLRYPQTGAAATDFTPDFVFGAPAFPTQSDTTKASLYRGPGHTGDLTAKLGATPAQASDADRIQSVGAGIVEIGTTVGGTQGDYSFWAGRVNDGVTTTRLIAVASYVGDNTSSRNISLNLTGATPTLIFVIPTNATAKVYRLNDGDTTGRNTTSGAAVADSITGMSADQITVGTALNATGETYDVWAIRTGFVDPQ
jgi:YD repeat-containing protein